MSKSESASLNTKLPNDEKRLFTETTEALGMTPSAAVRIFVRKFNEHRGFPFAVRRGFPMSDAERRDIALLDKAIDEGTAVTYGSFAELLNEIDEEIACENTISYA
ncbi:MAG: type II toxin-antitoxin system RelB/DinJ family antitoxin [Actinomycetes bacterium]|jgi:DNA-damage-inducible protein J|nr:type II toxin-antitoxin system RelB/DinJ family antitoxin [Actinomycetes bacterium]